MHYTSAVQRKIFIQNYFKAVVVFYTYIIKLIDSISQMSWNLRIFGRG